MAGAFPIVNILQIVLWIILPPVAVYIDQPAFDDAFIISIILCLCFWLPGVIFAFWTVFFGGRGQVKECPTPLQLMDILIFICCIILPPLAICIKQKGFTIDFIVSIILLIFFWFPSCIFAILVCFCEVTCGAASTTPVQA